AKMEIDVIDVFRFDDEGLISEMRAYWGKENMRLG
ncbi:MAG: Nuclear transport factor 2, partial [Sandaracinaceae bacterium]|nr:Nuclear transport factor 2 [Sandaracinaceae bacterium]